MQVTRIEEGFWRWTAPHPEWTPAADGWETTVGSLYVEPPASARDALVLIDPLAPPVGSEDADRFWRALDRDVERVGLPLCIVIANRFHSRSADVIAARYRGARRVEILAPREASGLVAIEPTATFSDGDPLPAGIVARTVEGLERGETALHLRARRALVFADAVLGVDGRDVRLPSESWAEPTDAGRALYRARFRASIERLTDLSFERLLTSHGEPVLEGGRDALRRALRKGV